MLITERGEYESASEDDDDPTAEMREEEDKTTYCDFESGQSLIVTKKMYDNIEEWPKEQDFINSNECNEGHFGFK
ncbi:hypothetical protein GUJ93_ZPchr0006g41819 [Zizania palustris]|uniref:Uncharacterized protein n=1 Tax=Zizania palustris TaxID=103762 RepID=A0A8J5TAZ9_ZIZPA|nr:hypothetical protein GUJ93_ZPchr0006g41819 [Zizania palustris]